MDEKTESSLAQIFLSWKRRERVSLAHIARFSGIARNTLHLIGNGITRHPTRATLDRIAEALATDPQTPYTRDRNLECLIRQELYFGAGYLPPEKTWPCTPLLETALYTALGDLSRARAWVALFRELRSLNVEQIRALGASVKPP